MTCTTSLHALLYLVCGLVLLITLVSIRLVLILHSQHSNPIPTPTRPRDAPASIAIFLGSGGHTAEMMRLVSHLDWSRYSTRTWIISSGDHLSERKALDFESTIDSGQFRILTIPRARRVHQSYLTSLFTTLYSFGFCLYHISLAPYLSPRRPRSTKFADLILLNGPGSSVTIALAAFIPKLLLGRSRGASIVYIESLARTRSLSWSAKLLRPIVDRFFVQWESLRTELLKKQNSKGGLGPRSWRLKAQVECQGWLV
ncbi:N-acetylglucosaminyldiphosphodolichol N-acetylglucosaminyltransferase anchoring subunit ALG14 [Sporobolomyces koalae]|uniref:N-acetylglucosaminyldiphosphodolichol N-acetylglucosaminyltransferase anchoring subunit ALG14 n=1 Tax=Sporobolomyces koalae TaxID=500713 RepID=UPI0031813DCE